MQIRSRARKASKPRSKRRNNQLRAQVRLRPFFPGQVSIWIHRAGATSNASYLPHISYYSYDQTRGIERIEAESGEIFLYVQQGWCREATEEQIRKGI